MSFQQILDGLLSAPGARGAAFLDPQGQTVAQAGDPAVTEVLGALQSVWLGELGRASDRAGLGAVRDLTLDFSNQRVLSAQVKEGYFLLVVFDAGGLTSYVRARLDEAREELAREVG
ncbi:MAG: roadblock/LC7 domain-containing protein [Acidithiobacillales bacterium]